MHSKLPPGTVLAERFRTVKVAGVGGMGVVYQARDLHSEKFVALKILNRSANNADERFSREAQLLADLHHPGKAGYVASGQTACGKSYLAMEWLEGETLEQRLERGPLRVAECQKLLERVASVLSSIHERGIIHRDVKPSNLFLCDACFERVVLLDFGVALRRSAAVVTALTLVGSMVGTLAYMSPEQVRSEATLTPASDIYSLGLVAHDCLTGGRERAADHAATALARILFEEAPPLQQICPRVPAPLSELVTRMLAKEAARRLADGTALTQELRALEPLDDLVAISTGSPPPPLPITKLRLHSLVLARATEVGSTGNATASGVAQAVGDGPPSTLEPILMQMGGQPRFSPDGSLLLTLPPLNSAYDQAARAARCALLIKTQWPSARVAVATGRGQSAGWSILGDGVGSRGDADPRRTDRLAGKSAARGQSHLNRLGGLAERFATGTTICPAPAA